MFEINGRLFRHYKAIGQEFDRVLLLLNGTFYYDAERRLQATQHPNPNYLYTNLFYQGASRVREKLALIIVEAPQLYRDMATIFLSSYASIATEK